MKLINTMEYSLETASLHADDHLSQISDVATPIHVSTTFEYPSDPDALIPAKDRDISNLPTGEIIYSRFSTPVVERVETVLGSVFGQGTYAVLYGSGLAAFTAALAHYNPNKLAMRDGYHGCHGVARVFGRLSGLEQVDIDSEIGSGDLLHLESPINPTGLSSDIRHYADRAHDMGAKMMIDATFGPPPLQDPFEFGVDMIMHSGTKYLGGHSDLLAGILVTKDPEVRKQLLADRAMLGTGIGNMEAWLLLRSLRTLKMRVMTQSSNVEKVVKWLNESKSRLPGLKTVYHSSLQTEDFVKKQLKNGYGATFAIEVDSAAIARALPSKLKLFHHATSLGGVESLVEWRAMTDKTISECILRFSIGVEDADDLIADIESAFTKS